MFIEREYLVNLTYLHRVCDSRFFIIVVSDARAYNLLAGTYNIQACRNTWLGHQTRTQPARGDGEWMALGPSCFTLRARDAVERRD